MGINPHTPQDGLEPTNLVVYLIVVPVGTLGEHATISDLTGLVSYFTLGREGVRENSTLVRYVLFCYSSFISYYVSLLD